ncbi:response regulator [Kineosporia sp. J2-2]|uniref:histidine kinase n=1 Tax=Kineosporia corallincola TaxID=2835133 RepID=A0ABS5TH86_9ACTN|nr:ATP-binding protein [Kineosporia corallincola]MBT0770228.1 response regulator [Kineosporia corallincola]
MFIGEDALLAEYGLPDLAPQEQLRAITRVAAAVCGVPNAVVNLLGGCFQHQVGSSGFEGGRSDLGDSMCARAIHEPELRYTSDARNEPSFRDNPWVNGVMARVRLYASAPLVLPDGRVLGTLCVFSDEPGQLTGVQRAALADLTGQVVTLFELARVSRESRQVAERAQRLAEEAERREALVSAVLDTIDVAVVACDMRGRLTLFNRAAREMHGVDADSSLDPGQWAARYDLFSEDGVTPLAADDIPLARALREGQVDDLLMVIAPAGRPALTLRVSGRTLHGDTLGVVGAVVAMTDVTLLRAQARELAQARDAAQSANEAKSMFLATVSHEIRTPLNGVHGMLELLMDDGLTEEQHERARIALVSTRTLIALLNGILDLSKGEAQQTSLRPRPIDPAALLHEVADTVRGSAYLKNLTVHVEVGDGVPALVRADPDRLRQILLNLQGNAVKFTTDGGVRSALEVPRPGYLRFSVSDTGPGISAEELPGLFRPFRQGLAGSVHGGTGLGLALCRQLVELMGGTIDVRSRPGGTTFTVDLPLDAAGPSPVPDREPVLPSARSGEAPLPSPEQAPLRVLLVDDDEVSRLVAGSLLRRLGVDVTTAGNGNEAVAAAGGTSFDLILLDRHMPGMDGLQISRALRRNPRTRDVFIVALTAAGDDQKQECLDAGMDDFVTKPVSQGDLSRLIERFVASRAASV